MEKHDYSKYKDYEHKKAIFEAIWGVFLFFTSLLGFFLPFLKIEEELFSQKISLIKYSLFNCIKEFFQNKEELGQIENLSVLSYAILIIVIVSIILSLLCLYSSFGTIINIDNHTISDFDYYYRVKMGLEVEQKLEEKEKNKNSKVSKSFSILGVIIFVVVAIKIYFENPEGYSGLLLETTGVTWLVILPIITLTCTIIFGIIGNIISYKEKILFLREKYEIEKENHNF